MLTLIEIFKKIFSGVQWFLGIIIAGTVWVTNLKNELKQSQESVSEIRGQIKENDARLATYKESLEKRLRAVEHGQAKTLEAIGTLKTVTFKIRGSQLREQNEE